MITQNTTPDGVVEATGGWLAPQDDGAEASDQLDVVRGHMTVEDVRRLLRERDGEVGVGVGVTGSITLCHALIGAGRSTSTASSSSRACSAAAGGCSPRGPTSG